MKIAIVGSGNVAFHIAKGIYEQQSHEPVIIARNSKELDNIKRYLSIETHAGFENVPEADLYILAVSDSAIPEVASQLRDKPLAHTSGATGIGVLTRYTDQCGVFYPFQTFAKQVHVDWKNIPIFIEYTDLDIAEKIKDLATSLSNSVIELESEQRKYLHLSGVFINNFVNHMAFLAQEILEIEDMELDFTYPLLLQTVKNIIAHEPYDIQTGPARRGDIETMRKHLELLEGYDELQEIYTVISNSIMKFYRKENLLINKK